LRRVDDGEVVGTVRLIAPDPIDLGNSFPTQRLCQPALLQHLPLDTTGEISRFAISKQRRGACVAGMLTRLALMRGIAQLSSEMGLTHWLAVMERGLLRLQQRNAIHFDPIGPLVSYHGLRQPAMGEIVRVLERIRREEFPTWNFLTDGGRWFGRQDTVSFPRFDIRPPDHSGGPGIVPHLANPHWADLPKGPGPWQQSAA
jgi:hypothetical protein